MQSNDENALALMEITGCASLERAADYIKVADGNLELAISLYLENGGSALSETNNATTSTNNANNTISSSSSSHSIPTLANAYSSLANDKSASSSSSSFSDHASSSGGVRNPIASKHDILVGGDGMDIFDDMERFQSRRRSNQMRGSSRAMRDESEIQSAFTADLGKLSNNVVSNDKASQLARMFETPRDIMFQGDFDSAREVATLSGKWLIITLFDPAEFVCEAMKRDVWNVKKAKQFIKDNFIFTMYMSESSDGKKHKTFYPFSGYPYVAIIDPKTGERMKLWNKPLTADQFIEEAGEFLALHIMDDAPARPEKKEKRSKTITELSEEEQLRLALAASMGDSELDLEDIMDDDVVILDGTDNDVNTGDKKVDVWDTIQSLTAEEPPQSDQTTRIQFRMPDGTRIVRRFLKTNTVRTLFEFVKSKLVDTNDANQRFEILNFRDGLFGRIDMTLVDAKVLNSSLAVEII